MWRVTLEPKNPDIKLPVYGWDFESFCVAVKMWQSWKFESIVHCEILWLDNEEGT